MFGKYFSQFSMYTFSVAIISLFFGIPIIVYDIILNNPLLSFPILFIFFLIVGYQSTQAFIEDDRRESRLIDSKYEKDLYEQKLNQRYVEERHQEELRSLRARCQNKLRQLQNLANGFERDKKSAESHVQLWKQTLLERSSGFPTLISYIEHFENLRDEGVANYLAEKKRPALRASDLVKEESLRRRSAESKHRQIQALLDYYEKIAPFLLDFKDEVIDEESENDLREFSDSEREDKVSSFVTTKEYRQLSTTERNQLALDRFWKRPKSKWLIGRLYERYVGYLFESKGYKVDYIGVFKGYEDLGRDLICTKGNEVVVIQCKNWSQFKTIYEKHIFQFFGTVFEYRDKNPGKKIRAVFYSTTKLSDLARRFGKELGIEIIENHKFDQSYPSIKCNISQKDGLRIYHLPFDQQYDTTRIEPKTGEFYCKTVTEAEEKGFRRAFRWKGD